MNGHLFASYNVKCSPHIYRITWATSSTHHKFRCANNWITTDCHLKEDGREQESFSSLVVLALRTNGPSTKSTGKDRLPVWAHFNQCVSFHLFPESMLLLLGRGPGPNQNPMCRWFGARILYEAMKINSYLLPHTE